jgi:hypothetical protein
MKLLKLLNKKNLSILISFFFLQNSYSIEPVDIWNLEKQPNQDNSKNEIIENENLLPSTIFNIQNKIKKEVSVDEEENFLLKNINITGIYDPSDNDLSIDMWEDSNGIEILKVAEKIKKIHLSNDATEILNIALLTNSYFPKQNISKEQFLKLQSDWLIKQQNFDLIETYINKNKNLENGENLIKYYLNYYLSRANLNKACNIFDKIFFDINDDYILKFNIYCLINLDKKEEAQLLFDLLKEQGFEDEFFEKKFAYLIGYDDNLDNKISEKTLLNFHLSHRTNLDFKFEPKINTSELIWKYLSSSNLLEDVDFIDLEDQDKIFTIEKATQEKNYQESELFSLYERFMFNINQLLTVEESHKLLPSSEARALLYQGVLITKETPEKIKLIKLLKDSFEKDGISEAFDTKLDELLNKIDETKIPSNYTNFYQTYWKDTIKDNKKIKFNDKIIHQSKILNYFKLDANSKNIEKDLENLLKKIKKDKKYFFSTKDLIMLESLRYDGVKISKKYKNIYEIKDPNIPGDIQILINNGEVGLTLLRLVEIIGEDKIIDIDSETFYFIVTILNQLDLDKLRNELLLKVLPLKV